MEGSVIGMEMEWKFSTEKDNVQWNGNGMEKKLTNQVEGKCNKM